MFVVVGGSGGDVSVGALLILVPVVMVVLALVVVAFVSFVFVMRGQLS